MSQVTILSVEDDGTTLFRAFRTKKTAYRALGKHVENSVDWLRTQEIYGPSDTDAARQAAKKLLRPEALTELDIQDALFNLTAIETYANVMEMDLEESREEREE